MTSRKRAPWRNLPAGSVKRSCTASASCACVKNRSGRFEIVAVLVPGEPAYRSREKRSRWTIPASARNGRPSLSAASTGRLENILRTKHPAPRFTRFARASKARRPVHVFTSSADETNPSERPLGQSHRPCKTRLENRTRSANTFSPVYG